MARVTVEDCVLQVPNRFDLVLLAGQRARDISAGQQLTVRLLSRLSTWKICRVRLSSASSAMLKSTSRSLMKSTKP